MAINIALDGPAGAGKSTIAKALAKKLGFIYVDTGALYRSIALYAINKGLDTKLESDITPILPEINIELKFSEGSQLVFLNGEDVSEKIRTPEVSKGASDVSAIPSVREFLFDLQRNIAKTSDIIMDGRDIGTVVLPNAQVKIFLTASPKKRANRRFIELSEKGSELTLEEVLAEINERDFNDSNREIAPLKQSDDAILIDTSDLNLEESIEKLYLIIRDKISNNNNKPVEKKKLGAVKMFFYQILRPFVALVFHLNYYMVIEGKENIPREGSYIYASNHRGYADPVMLSFPVRVPFSYMAKAELFNKNPFFTWLITTFGAFPVSRGKGDTFAIEESIRRLNSGYNLIIFPEGTRSKDGTVGKGKSGVALIAARAQVPVVPVGISFKGKLKFRSKVIIRYGKPISPAELKINSAVPAELKVLKAKIMNSIIELVETDVNKL